MRWNSPKVAINTFPTNDHYPDPGLCRRVELPKRSTVVEIPHRASIIARQVSRGGDEHDVSPATANQDGPTVRRRWNNETLRFFGLAKPAENTPADKIGRAHV